MPGFQRRRATHRIFPSFLSLPGDLEWLCLFQAFVGFSVDKARLMAQFAFGQMFT
jgi:hypothetical protein